MTTPILILTILLSAYGIATGVERFRGGTRTAPSTRAAWALAAVFAFTGMGHFVKTGGMVEMLPPAVPWRLGLVYASGVFEWALAAALCSGRTRRVAALVAIVMLAAFLPVNVYAAVRHVGMGGHAWGPAYLWVRIPLQAALVFWAWLIVRSGGSPRRRAISS